MLRDESMPKRLDLPNLNKIERVKNRFERVERGSEKRTAERIQPEREHFLFDNIHERMLEEVALTKLGTDTLSSFPFFENNKGEIRADAIDNVPQKLNEKLTIEAAKNIFTPDTIKGLTKVKKEFLEGNIVLIFNDENTFNSQLNWLRQIDTKLISRSLLKNGVEIDKKCSKEIIDKILEVQNRIQISNDVESLNIAKLKM